MKETDIKLWKANAPMKQIAGNTHIVNILLSQETADRLVSDHPSDYFKIIKTWQHALMNQIFYIPHPNMNGIDAIVACPYVADKILTWHVFYLTAQDGSFYISRVESSPNLYSADWLLLKWAVRTTKDVKGKVKKA